MDRSPLVLIMIQWFVKVYASDDCIKESAFTRNFTFDGKLALTNVTKSYTPVPSRSQCATKCVTYTGCESFFFNEVTQTCRLVEGQFADMTELPDTETHSSYYTLHIEEPCCRYTPPVSPTGVPRIAVAQSTTVYLFDQTGVNIMTSTLPATVRAMLYHPFQDRLYVGTEPVRSMKLDGTDIQTHGGQFTGTLMAFELNMYDNNMYMSISNYLVENLSPAGVYTNLANDPDVYKPRQNKIDTEENVLYWADEGFKCLKSKRLDGVSSVDTVFTTTELIWAIDIDFEERKIYWCARTTGNVYVYDIATSTNTLLQSETTTTGSCSGLSLYDGFMYLIFYKLDFIEKRFKNGTLADTLLQGNMGISTTKYFAIIE